MQKYHSKIITRTLFVLSMSVFSSYSMEKETIQSQNTLADCTNRVEQFLNRWAKSHELVKKPEGNIIKYRANIFDQRGRILNSYKKSFTDNLKILSLNNLGIVRIPESIKDLKGCVNVLDLSDNGELTSLPISLVTLAPEKDFSIRIENTPLKEKAGKAVLTSQDFKKMFEVKLDCVSRVGTFVDQLVELNPQMLTSQSILRPRANTDLEKINAIKNKITMHYVSRQRVSNIPGHILRLDDLDIRILPKEIVNLKGCTNKINLKGNSHLSLGSFPYEAAELGKDVNVIIDQTPLQSMFGVTEKALSEIVSEKKIRESGELANLALASKEGLTSEEGTVLPTELRQQILKSMVDKHAADKQAQEKKDAK